MPKRPLPFAIDTAIDTLEVLGRRGDLLKACRRWRLKEARLTIDGRVSRSWTGRVMTDDKLMLAAQAAGYSMIPPQDSAESDPEMVSPDAPAELSTLASAYFARLRAWLPAAPASPQANAVRGAVTSWLQSRAHA
jgi:hypothetical protein